MNTISGWAISITFSSSTRLVVMRRRSGVAPSVVRFEMTFITSFSPSLFTSHSSSLPAAATTSYTSSPADGLKNRGNRTRMN